jgi:hypothetical protein
MIIPRQKSFSENPEQREFNSKAAKERNYKWLKNSKIDSHASTIRKMEDDYFMTNNGVHKKLSDALKPNRYEKLAFTGPYGFDELNTRGRESKAYYGTTRKAEKLRDKAEKLDEAAEKKAKKAGKRIKETKEWKKSDKIFQDLRHSPELDESLAEEKARLRAKKQVDDVFKEEESKIKEANERAKKRRIIRENIKNNNKFSTKLKKGLKSILSKVK